MYVCVCVSHVAKFRLNTPSFNSSINFTKDIFLEVYYCSLMQVLSHGMVMSERAIYKGTKQDELAQEHSKHVFPRKVFSSKYSDTFHVEGEKDLKLFWVKFQRL